MIKHLKFAGIAVRDQDRALAFYTEKLGFDKLTDAPYGKDRWIEVAPPGAETYFVLFRTDNQPQRREGGPPDYVLVVDDLERTFETLQGRGVEFVQTPTKQSWGTGMYAVFVDPDGNRFLIGD